LGSDGEGDVMGGCDRVDNREAETMAAVVTGALGAEPLEWP